MDIETVEYSSKCRIQLVWWNYIHGPTQISICRPAILEQGIQIDIQNSKFGSD